MHIVERIPFHDALYFVTTTLSTVGFGDIVVSSAPGKMATLGMIFVGLVIIPVQTSQLYTQLAARRVALGKVLWPQSLQQHFRMLHAWQCCTLGICSILQTARTLPPLLHSIDLTNSLLYTEMADGDCHLSLAFPTELFILVAT